MEGATIDFLVAKNAVSDGIKQEKIIIDVPNGPAKQNIQVVVTDANGRRVIYEGVHKPGDHIERIVEGISPMRLQNYINGTLHEKTLP